VAGRLHELTGAGRWRTCVFGLWGIADSVDFYAFARAFQRKMRVKAWLERVIGERLPGATSEEILSSQPVAAARPGLLFLAIAVAPKR